MSLGDRLKPEIDGVGCTEKVPNSEADTEKDGLDAATRVCSGNHAHGYDAEEEG